MKILTKLQIIHEIKVAFNKKCYYRLYSFIIFYYLIRLKNRGCDGLNRHSLPELKVATILPNYLFLSVDDIDAGSQRFFYSYTLQVVYTFRHG